MARDIAKANRAIAEAWKKEKELVKKGMGTRDWTPDQQRDILATGKVHDADGKAFEGHHMKCVSQYPKFQGEPDNIQFLSREEHIKAHGGKTQNPTNGYYDYLLEKTIVMFDEDTLIPIEPKPLKKLADEVKEIMANESKPPLEGDDPPKEAPGTCDATVSTEKENKDRIQSEASTSGVREPAHNADSSTSEAIPVSDRVLKDEVNNEGHEVQGKADTNANAESEQVCDIHDPLLFDEDFEDIEDAEIPDYLLKYYSEEPKRIGIKGRIRDTIDDFRDEHPIASGIIEGVWQIAKGVGITIFQNGIDSLIEDSHGSNDRESGSNNPKSADGDSVPSVSFDIPDEDLSGSKRASPREHTVNDSGQHYWKGGERVWIPKKPYRRGGKKNEETEDD